jgi:hypothetical protein
MLNFIRQVVAVAVVAVAVVAVAVVVVAAAATVAASYKLFFFCQWKIALNFSSLFLQHLRLKEI